MGEPYLQLTEGAREKYMGLVEDYHVALQDVCDKAAGIQELCAPQPLSGTYESALLTKDHLELNVIGEFCPKLEECIAFLNEHAAAVDASLKQIQSEGHGA